MSERTVEREDTGTARPAGTDRPAGPAGAVEPVAYADCVLCGEPTEYPETTKGATLCPVCEWQEGQRLACSG